MSENAARKAAFVILVVVLVPFGLLATHYLRERDRHLERQRIASLPPVEYAKPAPVVEKEVYVPPEPVRYPLF